MPILQHQVAVTTLNMAAAIRVPSKCAVYEFCNRYFIRHTLAAKSGHESPTHVVNVARQARLFCD